jgi:hypothetical protein
MVPYKTEEVGRLLTAIRYPFSKTVQRHYYKGQSVEHLEILVLFL